MLARTGWWSHPRSWVLADRDLRRAARAPFDYSANVLDDLRPGGLYLLRGPRRVGKSVEVKKTIQRLVGDGRDPSSIVHFATDGLLAEDLRRIVDVASEFTPPEGRRHWFFDEITAIADGWPAAIKWLRDNDARFGDDTVVLTGSSASDLGEAVRALAGRRGGAPDADRVLLPMSFRAFVRARSDSDLPEDIAPLAVVDLTASKLKERVRALAPWLNQLVEEWHAYIRVGGFPQAVSSAAAGDGASAELCRDLFQVIHGEAFAKSAWSQAQSAAFTTRLAKGLASPTNRHDIATDLGTSRQSVGRRIDALREAFVVWPCYPERSLRPALRSQEKTYFADPVYARLFPQAVPPDPGPMSEQQLGVALVRSFLREDPASYLNFDSVLYHRTGGRREIDFVGPAFGDVAIESKYVDGERWARGAAVIRGSKWRGLVATRRALDTRDPDLIALPTAMLAWLIGG
ncbi:AAA family ATPase [Candidatus Palauibacter sp.]|uniref:AAA family ATPase n=1 Tax=Candidatus Palauibacter sp. TaxID=3101350 RepID=UPI003B5B45DF